VHIPTPALPSPSSAKGKGRARIPFSSAKIPKSALESSLLIQDVIKPLEERGFLAASLSGGARKWQGIILLPNKVGGTWEERRVRLEKIENGEGEYRRMDIKWVRFPRISY
jgi:DNA polymerase beta